MIVLRVARILIGILCLSAVVFGTQSASAATAIAEVLGDWVNVSSRQVTLCNLCGPQTVDRDLMTFYQSRNYLHIWTDERGPTTLGFELVEAIGKTEEQGLDPEDYRYGCLKAWLETSRKKGKTRPFSSEDLASLDILMTDAFVRLGRDLSGGRLDVYRLYGKKANKIDIYRRLNALDQHRNLNATLRDLAPSDPGYWRLAAAANEMKKVVEAGGWPSLPYGKSLKLGSQSDQMAQLREILRRTGDLMSGPAPVEDLFDDGLHIAVQMFQARHGLEVDGVVGPQTRAELNVSAEERLRQLYINLERWRWMPRNMDGRRVIVNVPEFRLRGYEGDQERLALKVIVGKPDTHTPTFSEKIRTVTLNPWWYVPESILPELDMENLDPSYRVDDTDGLMRVAQRPGPSNALGQVKILFPNRYSVYMHDTPSKRLFDRTFRAFSHGCIRVQQPIDLALFLLQDDPDMTRERLEAIIQTGRTRDIAVGTDSVVYIVYFTAWVREGSRVQFGPDLYKKDDMLKSALVEARQGAKDRSFRVQADNCRQVAGDGKETDQVAVR